MMKARILFIIFSLFAFSGLFAQKESPADALRTMLSSAEDTYDHILDLVQKVNQPELKGRMENALQNSVKLYNNFLSQVDTLTNDLSDPMELYVEKIKLGQALSLLLDKKFMEAEDRIKKAATLADYRYFWFERVMYVFLRSKVQLFNYFTTLENQKIFSKAESYLKKYQVSFKSYDQDIFDFIVGNRALYAGNSVFSKETYLIDDGTTGYISNASRVFGDLELLLEFLKGRFTDYNGLYVNFVTFRHSEAQEAKDQGILLYMNYEPMPAGTALENLSTVEVAVTGDNLEDILTFTLNQASQLVSMKAASDSKTISLSTKEINYKKYIEESLVLSRVAILKAELMYRKEIKRDEKEKDKPKLLEVGLRVTVGMKPLKKAN